MLSAQGGSRDCGLVVTLHLGVIPLFGAAAGGLGLPGVRILLDFGGWSALGKR